jgi:serine-type D-Ala-D-Ala carboxypeptidase
MNEKLLQAMLVEGVRQEIFPGAAAGIVHGPPDRRRKITLTAGVSRPGAAPVTAQTCFDLASLTKPLATTLAVLCLLKEAKIRLSDPLSLWWGEEVPPDKRAITLRCLLGHGSGLPAHRPYYEALVKHPPAERKALLRQWLLAEPLLYPPGQQRLYSDLDFMLLGLLIEEVTGQRLEQTVAEKVMRPLDLQEELFFQTLPVAGRQRIFAATENCPWRGRVLVGEVHDDNAHVLGGVAGHAGLFGTIGGVLALASHLLESRQGLTVHPGYRSADLLECLSPLHRAFGSSLLLGFDSPSPGLSSAGRFFSPASFGHLGFTGTSFWIDPAQDLVVVLLTNRIHPRRDNDRIKAFRPLFHDAVATALGLPAQSAIS